jgi:AP-3 complex subunit delta-1
MFEKSLYDLIRGMRNHKGSEREYIQASLRECRKEIRTQDMNLKATALLKLTYLEMFGHDMSWASFNVLEVMSSPTYGQKKIGYLAAIQSFRPDTEVLMLAENLLKKDLGSQLPVVITLPLGAIPHVINPSMANSLLGDLLPRLTHSQPGIRKKTIVTLYRLALVYPETLRPAWPKIKERLQDENEDPSVTSAIINVVCELGWRRPQDFLPLAPRLFDLLVEGGNNWMAIKIIKLFATLTPLEPRLIKKLLPPLTNIIKTTPAMSLLYESIHGIVEGGVLESIEGTTEGDELARLCVGKLRSMLVVEGDPNLKYVALLAFQKIVTSHPYLVSLHQDVILQCIDDPDISIRMRALDLAVGMVNPDNLQLIVDRLVAQLLHAPFAQASDEINNDRGFHDGIEPKADSDEEDAAEALRREKEKLDLPVALPEDYRVNAIQSILTICSRDTYANVSDFEWYIDVLVKLVKACPSIATTQSPGSKMEDISLAIGEELQNVAVRVKSLRPEATIAAQSLLLVDTRPVYFPTIGNGGQGVLGPAAWVAGEYAEYLNDADGVLSSLIHESSSELLSTTLATFIHSALKVFATICKLSETAWNAQNRTHLSITMARFIHFLEKLSNHPALEVQERAVEYLELLRLASEAAQSSADESSGPPLLLTQAIPNLFIGMDLNPVAPGALSKVPIPDDLDLDTPINPNLHTILADSDSDTTAPSLDNEFDYFYTHRSDPTTIISSSRPAAEQLDAYSEADSSYQQTSASSQLDSLKRKQNQERNKDDPFYIGDSSDTASSRLRNIIKSSNGEDLDIDSIPIMDLSLETSSQPQSRARTPDPDALRAQAKRKAQRKKIEIAGDETLDGSDSSSMPSKRPSAAARAKRSLLAVDSGGLGSLSLDDGDGRGRGKLDIEQREEEERALREVERLRLEMQRASERIHAKEEAVVVRKKKKKKPVLPSDSAEGQEVDDGGEGAVKKKKKKKKIGEGEGNGVEADGADEVVATKKKKVKRRVAAMDEPEAA